jgi:hypothetical protein
MYNKYVVTQNILTIQSIKAHDCKFNSFNLLTKMIVYKLLN